MNKNNLKAWRTAAGYSREQLASLLKVSTATLSRIENGLQDPRPELRNRICVIFNEAPGDFYSDKAVRITKMHGDPPPEFPNVVGKNVHRLRVDADLTVDQLAEKAGILPEALLHLEQTGLGYDDEIIPRIAGALGQTPGTLFNEQSANEAFLEPKLIRWAAAADILAGINPDSPRVTYNFDALLGSEQIWEDASFSDHAFAIKVPDDSMTPIRAAGDILIMDPEVQPMPNNIVLGVGYNLEPMIRRYRLISPGPTLIYELVAANDAYPSLRSDENELEIKGVELKLVRTSRHFNSRRAG